jgi:hypothetical protein
LEREAEAVGGMPVGLISSANSSLPQRKSAECQEEEEALQRKGIQERECYVASYRRCGKS